MRIVVAYKWTSDPEEATVRADGTVDWSRAKPGLSTYDPVAMEMARQLAEAAGAELVGVTVGGKGIASQLCLDRLIAMDPEELPRSRRSETRQARRKLSRRVVRPVPNRRRSRTHPDAAEGRQEAKYAPDGSRPHRAAYQASTRHHVGAFGYAQ